jgi:hypothetical protein
MSRTGQARRAGLGLRIDARSEDLAHASLIARRAAELGLTIERLEAGWRINARHGSLRVNSLLAVSLAHLERLARRI